MASEDTGSDISDAEVKGLGIGGGEAEGVSENLVRSSEDILLEIRNLNEFK